MSSEKHLPATPERLQKARREGDVPRSRAWGALGVLAGGASPLFLRVDFTDWQALAQKTLLNPGGQFGAAWLQFGLTEIGPSLMGASLGGLLGALTTGGWTWAPSALRIRFERLDPFKGAKRLVEPKIWTDGVRDLAWVLVVSVTLAWVLSVPGLRSHPRLAIGLLLGTVLILGVPWALLDGSWSKRAHARRHRMSFQDLKEETRRREGDPQTKQERRHRGRRLIQESLQERVASATVVLVNPSHLAVALAHEAGSTEAPIVIARGRDEEASRIRRIARQAGVPIVRQVALARSLYRVEEAEPIPELFYGPVAAVLCRLLIEPGGE